MTKLQKFKNRWTGSESLKGLKGFHCKNHQLFTLSSLSVCSFIALRTLCCLYQQWNHQQIPACPCYSQPYTKDVCQMRALGETGLYLIIILCLIRFLLTLSLCFSKTDRRCRYRHLLLTADNKTRWSKSWILERSLSLLHCGEWGFFTMKTI